MARRDYGTGSVYKRASDGKWCGTLDAGSTDTGARRRITVVRKTQAEAKRALAKKRAEIDAGRRVIVAGRATVRSWAKEWLPIQERRLRPASYNATKTAVNRWIVPTIGRRRLTDLRPADVRAIATAQREAGRSSSNAQAAQRVLRKMLRDAQQEGHRIAPEVLATKLARMAVSDRTAITPAELQRLAAVIEKRPDGVRWAIALLTGMRRAECLGLTWEAVDWRRSALVVQWQLQPLPYVVARDRTSGFRVPDGYEARHLVDSYHLTRPKSRAGFRVAPLPPAVMLALREWQEKAGRANPWGLAFPTTTGRPRRGVTDLEEWRAIQAEAGVAHPDGRPYLVHECRHTAATRLQQVGADEHTITTLMGHSSIAVSRGYMHTGLDGARAAIEAAAKEPDAQT
ncbi:MAG: site-specific integrase [Anaerolineales bacterium]|nr:site-specific integrase [Anaerolineales bacterium]